VPWDNSPEKRARDAKTYGDPEYKRNRAIVRRRSGGRCEMLVSGRPCGSRDRVQCDHIRPKSQGGGNGLENLRDLCHAHHAAKTAAESGATRRAPRRDPVLQQRTRW
jgi:5-methylcytosine-specific restriction endonuclease McrA